MDIKNIADIWNTDKSKFEELGSVVAVFIKSTISECELLPEITWRTKDLLSIVKKIKKKQLEKEYTYNDLNDKLGIRIICSFQEDMEIIDSYLEKYFVIKKREKKKDELDIQKLDYLSNHYDVSIKTSISPFDKIIHLKDLVFEIQVRTLNQHAWANTAHSLSYKQEANISSLLMRKVYRLLSLYEIADDEFSAVNKALIEDPDNIVYKLLRKLESKIYKYAQVDYDREISIYTIRKIVGYLNATQIQTVFSEIDNFINLNDFKINRIFNDNRIRFYEIPVLTQPEIFLIWYCLEKYTYTISDNWNNDFDSDELEQIKTLWGSQID